MQCWDAEAASAHCNTTELSRASFVRPDPRLWLLHLTEALARKSAGEGRQGGRGQHLVLLLQLNCFKLLKHWGSFLTYFRASFRNCWDVFCSVCVEFSWITEERNLVGLLIKSDLFKKKIKLDFLKI